ncbi:MAG: DUF2007 domain-containing protein [Bacteroidales bacterium]|nr:DUF2007 domain-containing protein [Candidatus Sodaliphilus aphodohippi]
MEREDEIVEFGKYENIVDANIIKGTLESNGVIAGVISDSTATAIMMTPAKVVVMRRDLERARAILDSEAEQ